MSIDKKLFLIEKDEIQSFFIAVAVFISFNPFFLWPFGAYIFIFSAFLLLIPIIVNNKYSERQVAIVVFVFLLVIIYKILQGASVMGATLLAMAVSSFVLINSVILEKSFNYLLKILAFFILFGLLTWFFQFILNDFSFLLLGYVSSSSIPNILKSEVGVSYAIYPFSTRIINLSIYEFYRFQSVFDEPGYLGTVSAFLFIINKCSVKTTVDKIILAGGIFSFSLAFYFLIFIFIAARSLSSFKFLMLTLSVILFFLVVINFFDPLIIIFDELILDRARFSDGRLIGDNRASDHLDSAFALYLSSGDLRTVLFGLGDFEPDGTSSIKQIFVQAGLVGFLLVFLVLSIFSLIKARRLNWDCLIFVFIFVISMYQRPDVLNITYIYLLCAGLVILSRIESNPLFKK